MGGNVCAGDCALATWFIAVVATAAALILIIGIVICCCCCACCGRKRPSNDSVTNIVVIPDWHARKGQGANYPQ
jgi:hypothetical protein